jgi:hypothetical protein
MSLTQQPRNNRELESYAKFTTEHISLRSTAERAAVGSTSVIVGNGLATPGLGTYVGQCKTIVHKCLF